MKDPKSPKKPQKKRVYKSPETRARQLAGLANVRIEDHVMGVQVEKVNGQGYLAGVSDDMKKQVIQLYCEGYSIRAIVEKTGVSQTVVHAIKTHGLDHDSQFREKMYQASLKEKLQQVAAGAADRVIELMPEMSAKDSVLAMGIATDKLAALERNRGPESLHQHVHVHTTAEVGDAFMQAMKPK
jgi:transposase-like protein